MGSAADLAVLSPGFFHPLFPRHGLLSKVGNHIHKAQSFWQSFAYKPNLKGRGHEGPYHNNAAALHASTDIPCLGLVLSPGQERVTTSTEGLELHFGLLNASATRFDTSGHAAPSFLQVF